MKLLRYYFIILFIVLFCSTLPLSCKEKQRLSSKKNVPLKTEQYITLLQPSIIKTIRHDPDAFTQGLCIYHGLLYESTGLYGKSQIRTIDTTNGVVQEHRKVKSTFFAEGCALLDDKIYQLTWKKETCIVYDLENLKPVKTLTYSGPGWGLCTHTEKPLFFMSNGSDTIYERNSSFQVTRAIPVTFNGAPLINLNELEYARGFIYANVWYSDIIFEINPTTGAVTRQIDCTNLVQQEAPASDECVLNGIAYDVANDRFYLTGKLWKKMFVVEINQQPFRID